MNTIDVPILPRIHTMWIGSKLSKLELLTLSSFLSKGHAVTLWAYDEIKSTIPSGVELQDAERIFPKKRIRPKLLAEPELGIGKGSVGGVYSDLFRYKVLYERGGIWSDMDVTALRAIDLSQEYIFRPHRLGAVASVLKCPKHSSFLKELYVETEAVASELTPWMLPLEILNKHIRNNNFEKYIVRNFSNRDRWSEVYPYIVGGRAFPSEWYAMHWMNERWRTLLSCRDSDGPVPPSKDLPPCGTALSNLYVEFNIA